MSDDLEKLRAKVALMRELGITEDSGTKLGPPIAPPKKEITPEEYLARIAKEKERHRDIQFAASATRPYLMKAAGK